MAKPINPIMNKSKLKQRQIVQKRKNWEYIEGF